MGTKRDEDAPEILERALLQRSSIINRRPRVYDTFEGVAECASLLPPLTAGQSASAGGPTAGSLLAAGE